MRSDTAFFSAAVMDRRFRFGFASDSLSATAAFLREERRGEGRAVGADAPSICSTSVNALISAWRRSISLWRSAIACAMSLMGHGDYWPARRMSTLLGWMPGSPREVLVVRFMASADVVTDGAELLERAFSDG